MPDTICQSPQSSGWIYWLPEDKSKWKPILATEQARELAIKKGAMFFTSCRLSEPYKGNGQPEPHRWGDFVSDFDDLENPEKSIEEARQLCFIYVPELYDVDPYAIHYFHSGSRGPHIVIPAILFGAQDGDPYLPDIYKKIACEWATKFQFTTMDLTIYNMQRGRMFRIPNVRRSNGRYKVPLTKDEFESLLPDELLELTKTPRNIEPVDVDLEPAESLVELYQRAWAEVYAEQEIHSKESNLTPEQIGKLSNKIPDCIDYILTKCTTKTNQVNFNKLVMMVVTYFQAAGWEESAAIEKSKGLIERFTESQHYDTVEKRKEHFRVEWKYLRDRYTFGCSYILGLRLPGSAFDCRVCQIANRTQEIQPEAEQTFSGQQIQEALSANQDGDARLFCDIYRNRFVYDHSVRQWFKWENHYWAEDYIKESMAALDSVIDLYAREAAHWQWERLKATRENDTDATTIAQKMEESYLKRISSLQSLQRKQAVLTLATVGSRSLGITGEEWDKNPWLLGCANGTIDLKSGEFRPGRQEDFIKSFCPTRWIGLEAQCPTHDRFIYDIFDGDDELGAFLRRLGGYSIFGENIEHILPIFWGIGRNGKGTLLENLNHVLGPLAGPIKAEMLLEQRQPRSSASPNSDIINLMGKRIVWASETDEGRKLNAGKIKWLTGNDTLCGRKPYGDREISFRPSHTLFLITNHKPTVDPTDYATWQRIFLVPFTLSFVDDPIENHERKRDPYLLEKLKAEAPGVLAWLVRGCIEWQQQGLNPPEKVKAATEEYRKDEDTLSHFLDEACTITAAAEVKSGDLYKRYRQWCEQMGHGAVNGTVFGKRMKSRFDSYQDYRGIHYVGLGLKYAD